MRTAKVTLSGMPGVAYSQGRHYSKEEVPMLPKEGHDDYEKRTWRNRMHFDQKGMVFIPPMALKNCLSDAAQYLSIRIPGKGQATYTKHFDAGLMCMDPAPLCVHRDEVKGNWLFVPSDGKKGGRVMRCFPVVHDWQTIATFHILDGTITDEVFREHLEQAGTFIGIGVFRPRNGGFQGRFTVDKIEWSGE